MIFSYNRASIDTEVHLWLVDKEASVVPTHTELVGMLVCVGDILTIEPVGSLDEPTTIQAADPEFFKIVARELRPFMAYCRSKCELD